jgi:molecular chaperone HtpG
MKETKAFEANISELMHMIIHSFYSQQDVFLRELISNASDAIDRQRIQNLRDGKVNIEYEIKINPFYGNNALLIEDNGIGMSYDDLVEHLSTIATSGTKEFVKHLQDKSDLIGQFGVGFYSAFLVADKVEVITTKDGRCWKWVSDANQYYTIEEIEDFTIAQGTRIILYLKEDCKSYLEEAALRRIIHQYSSFILYPIRLFIEKEVSNTVESKDEEDDTEIVEEEEIHEDQVKDENVTTEKVKIQEWEIINGERPIWYNKPQENTEEQYENLYKTLSKDWKKPLFWRHFQTEGNYEFKGILYIPSEVPFDMLGERNREKRSIKLYVKKVLILDELDKEMLPDWMNFVIGVIDSADLPLNVSREMLQQNKIVKALKTQLKKYRKRNLQLFAIQAVLPI